jgi:hypothetical protein
MAICDPKSKVNGFLMITTETVKQQVAAARRELAEKILDAIDNLNPTLARGSASLMKTWAREAVERTLTESGVDLTSTQKGNKVK